LKTGLVMEGGALRGLFTAGILDVMLENGLRVDGAVGVSAGAVFGCNYKSHQSGRVLRYNITYCRDRRYCSLWSLLKTGDLYGAEFCYHTLPEKLDRFDCESYRRDPMPFYVVCTDINTGLPLCHECPDAEHENLEWMRASASMPLVSNIVNVGGRELLDGGISDPIPLRTFENMGYDRNIVILTREDGYIKEKSSIIPLLKIKYRSYPKLVQAMADRHTVYNEQRAYAVRAERDGRCLVLRPSAPLPVKRLSHDPESLRLTYALGRRAAETHLDEMRAFLLKFE